MKIAIVDTAPHEELKEALDTYGITLEHKAGWSEDICTSGYGMVILCSSGKEQMLDSFENKKLSTLNAVIMSEYIDSRFINSCRNHGCKDIIRVPYNPQAAANRLNTLVESITNNHAYGSLS